LATAAERAVNGGGVRFIGGLSIQGIRRKSFFITGKSLNLK
jgi:hypothetical protein